MTSLRECGFALSSHRGYRSLQKLSTLRAGSTRDPLGVPTLPQKGPMRVDSTPGAHDSRVNGLCLCSVCLCVCVFVGCVLSLNADHVLLEKAADHVQSSHAHFQSLILNGGQSTRHIVVHVLKCMHVCVCVCQTRLWREISIGWRAI